MERCDRIKLKAMIDAYRINLKKTLLPLHYGFIFYMCLQVTLNLSQVGTTFINLIYISLLTIYIKIFSRPVLSYGSVVWALQKWVESRIMVREMSFMWKTIGFLKWYHRKDESIFERSIRLYPPIPTKTYEYCNS